MVYSITICYIALNMHATLAVCQCGDDSTQSYSTP